jgi:hypothetical protein
MSERGTKPTPFATYDAASETGSVGVLIRFERGLSKDAYEARKRYVLQMGGSEADAAEYAGHLDHAKPGAVAAAMAVVFGENVNWQQLIADAMLAARKEQP